MVRYLVFVYSNCFQFFLGRLSAPRLRRLCRAPGAAKKGPNCCFVLCETVLPSCRNAINWFPDREERREITTDSGTARATGKIFEGGEMGEI